MATLTRSEFIVHHVDWLTNANWHRTLKTKRLYRSARPDEATLGDRQELVDEHGVKSIIDLRTK